VAATLGQGGAERQLFYIARTLREQGAGVRVLTLAEGEFWEESIRSLGIPVAYVGACRSRLMRLRAIVKELRANRPELVQSQHFDTNLYAALASRILGLRELGAIRNDFRSEVARHGLLLGGLSARFPRRMAANSMAAIQTAVTHGIPRARLHLLPNVVDTDCFQPGRGAAGTAVRLLAAGRLVPQKRFDRFLALVAGLRHRTRTPVRGTLVGGGALKRSLMTRARELGLKPEELEFMEPVEDIRRLLQRSDVLVVTSDHEGTPNVVLEAMACGLPIVATAVGGIPEVVQDGVTGFLAKLERLGDLEEQALRLVEDAEMRARLGRQAREYVETHHSLKRLPGLLEGLYQWALS